MTLDRLRERSYPAANLAIVSAVRLSVLYLITDEPDHGEQPFLRTLQACLESGARLVQLRTKTLDGPGYRHLAQAALALCRAQGAQLLLNSTPQLAAALDADGVHLSSAPHGACRAAAPCR